MARKKAFIGAAISLGTSIVGGLMSSAAKRRQQEEQQRQQEAVYRAKEGSNMASSYNQQHANDYDLSLENERLYTSSLFKGGGSVNLKRKRNGIQENDAIKVNKPEISSKDEEKRRKEGFRRYQSKRDATLLGIKAVAQILDPTGVSSYPDIAANYVKEGGFGNNTINSLLTAVPLLGTAGKAVSVLTKGNRLRNRSGKVTGFLRDVNLYNNRKKFKPLVNDFIDNADDALKIGDLNKAKNSVKAAKNVSNRYNKIDNGAIPSIDKSQTIIRSILESEDIKNGYDAISTYRSGGSIHIKDSKKGTFTAAAKKRGQSVQGFASKVLANKDNYSPTMVKKAVFAHNAPKWKHRLGGIVNTLFRLGGGTKLKATKRATKQNLGLENANKVGVNAPTAYRRLASESSQPSRTILSSEDKVVQKALESAISISPVKEVDDTRTTYKGGGKADVKLNNDKDGKQRSKAGYEIQKISETRFQKANKAIFDGIVNFIDPTGISNYPELYNSIKRGDSFNNVASNIVSSIPVVGKVGQGAKVIFKNKTLNRISRRLHNYVNRDKYIDKATHSLNETGRKLGIAKEHNKSKNFYYKKKFDDAIVTDYNSTSRNLENYYKLNNSPLETYNKGAVALKEFSNVFNSVDRVSYRNGGKADVNNIITEGGDAKKIGHQTFLLRGRKHRNGGIVLGKGRNAIEAEGGEVVKIDKNTMKILSTVPMANGESPANRVLKGENPNKVFDSQEQFKDRNNLNNKKYQDGGSKNISGRTTESFGTRKNNSFINSPLRIRSINNEFVNDKTKTDVKFVGGKEQKYETVPVFKKNNFNLLSDRDNNTVNRISDSLSNNYYLKNRKSIQNLNGYLRIIKDASIIGANAAIKNVPNVIEGLNDLNNNLDRNFEEPKLLDRYYENIPIDINLKENNNTNKQLENMLRYINGRPNMRLGGKSSLIRRKAALGDYLNLAGDAFNIISPLLGGSRTKRAINRMVAPTQPTQLQPANLRTTYNIQPQLTDVYNAEQQSIAETNRNTASSVAAQARGTRLRQLGLNQRNQLRGQQQNIETQLINQNRLNRQQVTNQNIAATNDWRDRVSQFVNDQIVSKANVDNQIIENVSAGIRDLQLRGDKNKQERNALTAIMASNPEQVNLFMKKRKEYENLLDRNSRSLLRPYRCGGSVKRKMKR